MTWLVITASAVVAGGIQSAEIRYPVHEFNSYAACKERLLEHNKTGTYAPLIGQKTIEMMFMLTTEFNKHADEVQVKLHCEGSGE